MENGINSDDAPFSDVLPVGSKLLSGQYEIQRYLSSGGFGITYLAKDSLNRTVVIKECFPEAFCTRVNRTVRARTQNYVEDFRATVQLFVKEAHALSKLNHPSVVGVHQVFEDNETAYMALDLIDGKDLLEIIETGMPKLPPEAIRKMTLKVLDAVAHVHAQDLLHRDISPDNILVDKTGHPVLIDFGAAREEASRKSRVLSAVMVVKDGYSPQEFYVAGSRQLPCSDLYALAATLVHLITGEAPPNSHARLAAMASKQPDPYVPLTGRFPDYESAFLEAIDEAMNVAQAERIQTAEDWMLRIDHDKRVELARAQAQSDKSIDQTVMALVKSERMSVAQVRQRAPHAEEFERAQGRKTPSAPAHGTAQANMAAGNEVPGFGDHYSDMHHVASDFAEDDGSIVEVEEKPSPYVRVTSRALESAKKKPRNRAIFAWVNTGPLQRAATVPIVFCAYFYFAHAALQSERVQSLTLAPLVEFSTELTDLKFTSVNVRRGLGD